MAQINVPKEQKDMTTLGCEQPAVTCDLWLSASKLQGDRWDMFTYNTQLTAKTGSYIVAKLPLSVAKELFITIWAYKCWPRLDLKRQNKISWLAEPSLHLWNHQGLHLHPRPIIDPQLVFSLRGCWVWSRSAHRRVSYWSYWNCLHKRTGLTDNKQLYHVHDDIPRTPQSFICARRTHTHTSAHALA